MLEKMCNTTFRSLIGMTSFSYFEISFMQESTMTTTAILENIMA